jgi:signal transduction histidine kinase
MTASPDLVRAYESALADYLNGNGEVALESAYELGRRALADGVGVLELTGLYEHALAAQLDHNPTAESAATIERGSRFLLESLSPFEMTHRGFREANTSLRFLNDILEQRTEEAEAAREQAEDARKQAEEANRAKSNFLAVMSHELRTPLNAVLGYSDLLDAGVAGPLNETQIDHVAHIRSSARHLLELIEETLAFAKIESGREKVNLEYVGCATVMQEAADLIEPAAAERGIEFRIEMPKRARPLRTDARKLRQILVNLLSNAVKFTERGQVTLRAEVDADWVTLQVEDTGIGIPREHLDHIFDRFWQVERTTTRRTGGTGLGLSVARHLARMLGGDITVESTPGHGSVFRVRLPTN